MSEPYIIFNGTDSRTLGVIMAQLPDFVRPEHKTEITPIPGGDPAVYDLGMDDLMQTTMRINLNGANRSSVYKWLSGEGWLVSSDEPTLKRYVYLHGRMDDSRFRVTEGAFDTITVPVEGLKFLREASESPITRTSAGTFAGKGNEKAHPVIEVTGTGDINLMINSSTVLINGLNGSVTIDCEAGMVYREVNGVTEWAGSMVQMVEGWPELNPGGENNSVNWTGSVSQVKIQPQWRFL